LVVRGSAQWLELGAHLPAALLRGARDCPPLLLGQMAALVKAIHDKRKKEQQKNDEDGSGRSGNDDNNNQEAPKTKKREEQSQSFNDELDGIDPVVIKAFQKCDRDGSERVGTDELCLALESLGRGLTERQAKRIINEAGPLLNKANLTDSSGKCNAVDVFGFARLYALIDLFKPNEPFLSHSIRGRNKTLPYQREVRRIYMHPVVVWSVALIIIANFIINIVEKEIDPDVANLQYAAFWSGCDTVFNILFLLELLANMYGYGFGKMFWGSGWNVFDFVIVAVGILLMTGIDLGGMAKLKLMRAFRVFRLFKRIKSLNKIITALLSAVPGVANAFIILFIFFCIYAILAVELFRDFGSNGTYMTDDLNDVSHINDAYTPRGYTNGREYYGTWTRAMYSMFQLMTGDSWAEALGRPLVFGLYQKSTFTAGAFFISFIILTNMVLTNVVVAVLLDKFVAPPSPPMTDEEVNHLITFIKWTSEKEKQNREAAQALLPPPDPTVEPRPPSPKSALVARLAAEHEQELLLPIRIERIEKSSQRVAALLDELFAQSVGPSPEPA
jgi:hypothetical protein